MTGAESDADAETVVCEICGERFESDDARRRHVHDQGIVD